MRIVLSTALALLFGATTAAHAQTATSTDAAAPRPAEVTPAISQETPPVGDEDHQSLLEGFRTRIALLQGEILGAQEKVEVLKDTVLEGRVARARAIIIHQNEMGSAFVLERAVYRLDGGVIFDQEDTTGGLDEREQIELFNGPIRPGTHKINVTLVFRGGSIGPFTYVGGYKFKVDSKYEFKVIDGRLNTLRIVGFDKSSADITKETADRLGVRYDVDVMAVPGETPTDTPPVETPPVDAAPAPTPAPTPAPAPASAPAPDAEKTDATP